MERLPAEVSIAITDLDRLRPGELLDHFQVFSAHLDASEVPVMLLAEDEDVVTERLEPHRSLPHVLRHLDAFADLVLALDEQFAAAFCAPTFSRFKTPSTR